MCKSGSCGSSSGCSSLAPVVVNPIVSSSEYAGKYSVRTKVKKTLSGGAAENIYTGESSTATLASDRTLDFYNAMVPIISDIIRSLVSDTYADPSATTSGTVTANYSTLTGFQSYYAQSNTGAALNKINHITSNLYLAIKAGGAHVGVDPASAVGTDVCATAGGRLFANEIATCLFGFELIMA